MGLNKMKTLPDDTGKAGTELMTYYKKFVLFVILGEGDEISGFVSDVDEGVPDESPRMIIWSHSAGYIAEKVKTFKEKEPGMISKIAGNNVKAFVISISGEIRDIILKDEITDDFRIFDAWRKGDE